MKHLCRTVWKLTSISLAVGNSEVGGGRVAGKQLGSGLPFRRQGSSGHGRMKKGQYTSRTGRKLFCNSKPTIGRGNKKREWLKTLFCWYGRELRGRAFITFLLKTTVRNRVFGGFIRLTGRPVKNEKQRVNITGGRAEGRNRRGLWFREGPRQSCKGA